MTASWTQTEVYQQSFGTPLVTDPHLTPSTGDGCLVHQSSHPEDRVLHPATFCAGHQAPGTETVLLGSGPPTQGTDKAGPTLAWEARSNLPQLAWVGPSEKSPVLAVSLQQLGTASAGCTQNVNYLLKY